MCMWLPARSAVFGLKTGDILKGNKRIKTQQGEVQCTAVRQEHQRLYSGRVSQENGIRGYDADLPG